MRGGGAAMQRALAGLVFALIGLWLPARHRAASLAGHPVRYDLTKGILESITSTPVDIGTAQLKDLRVTSLDLQLRQLEIKITR